MKHVPAAGGKRERGFSLLEVLIALAITMVVMASVFLLLQQGQDSFEREPEISDMTQAARSSVGRVSSDLALAGYNTPPAAAVMWSDGGGIAPDTLTMIYADAQVPVAPTTCAPPSALVVPPEASEPPTQWARLSSMGDLMALFVPGFSGEVLEDGVTMMQRRRGRRGRRRGGNPPSPPSPPPGNPPPPTPPPSGGGGGGGGGGACSAVETTSSVNVDIRTVPTDLLNSFENGMGLMAIETTDCSLDGTNGDGLIGMVPITLTSDPVANGSDQVTLSYSVGSFPPDVQLPPAYNNVVHPNCAQIGLYRVVQYRVNPPPPATTPALQRREIVANGATWTDLAPNIENFQVQYASGINGVFNDVPGTPIAADPNTWITGVRITVSGRSESTNLKGATPGVFAAEDTHLRRAFTTTVSLRNQLGAAQVMAGELGQPGWN